MDNGKQNTDWDLWRGADSDRVFITESGALGIDIAGRVMVKTPRMWLELASLLDDLENRVRAVESVVADVNKDAALIETLAQRTQQLAATKIALAAAREVLPFFRSVIKSGEEWTDTCETRYQAAMGRMDA
jgi:hypothetical protein